VFNLECNPAHCQEASDHCVRRLNEPAPLLPISSATELTPFGEEHVLRGSVSDEVITKLGCWLVPLVLPTCSRATCRRTWKRRSGRQQSILPLPQWQVPPARAAAAPPAPASFGQVLVALPSSGQAKTWNGTLGLERLVRSLKGHRMVQRSVRVLCRDRSEPNRTGG
jgi:hypothetical protein